MSSPINGFTKQFYLQKILLIGQWQWGIFLFYSPLCWKINVEDWRLKLTKEFCFLNMETVCRPLSQMYIFCVQSNTITEERKKLVKICRVVKVFHWNTDGPKTLFLVNIEYVKYVNMGNIAEGRQMVQLESQQAGNLVDQGADGIPQVDGIE